MPSARELRFNDPADVFSADTQLLWLPRELPQSSVVLATECELHRNLAEDLFPPFNGNLDVAEKTAGMINQVVTILSNQLKSSFTYSLAPDMVRDNLALKRLLIMQHVEHAEFFANTGPRYIHYRNVLDLFCVINGADHLIIKNNSAGLQPSELTERLLDLESIFHEHLTFARNPYFGYLTADAALCGTGFRAKAAMNLPGLMLQGHQKTIDNAAEELGFTVRHLYSNNPDDFKSSIVFVTASNLPHCKPQEIAARLVDFAHRLEQHEKDARLKLLKGHWSSILIDKAKRALAVLLNATLMRPGEAIDFLNDLWVADDLGLVPLTIPHDRFMAELSYALNRYAVEIPRPKDKPFNLETDSLHAERLRQTFGPTSD